jgi:methionine-rich copper-binding protein CopC
MKLYRFLAAVALISLLGAAPALAHGDLNGTTPSAGATVKKAPDHIVVNFTETPAKATRVAVTDGCDFGIVTDTYTTERAYHVLLDPGHPGQWTVDYKVLSAEDGHTSDGSYNFSVRGKAKDCSVPFVPAGGGGGTDDPDEPPDDAPGETGEGDEGSAAPLTDPLGDGSSFPVVPVALGSVAVLALALAVRLVTEHDAEDQQGRAEDELDG